MVGLPNWICLKDIRIDGVNGITVENFKNKKKWDNISNFGEINQISGHMNNVFKMYKLFKAIYQLQY